MQGNAVRIDTLFDIASLNVIWSLASGQRFEYEDEESLEMIANIESFTMEKTLGPISGVRYLTKIPPFRAIFSNLKTRMEAVKAFLRSYISKLKDLPDTGYIEAFETEKDKRMANDGVTPKFFTDEQLIVSLEDFFTGGSGTMAKTLSFSILFLLHHPKAQDKIRREIESLGQDEIDVTTRDKIPYTEAFLNEVQRLSRQAFFQVWVIKKYVDECFL